MENYLDDQEALELFEQARKILQHFDRDPGDLDRSLYLFERVLQESDPRSSLRFYAARDMAVGLVQRYRQLGQEADLDIAISHTTKIIDHFDSEDVRAHAFSLRATCKLTLHGKYGREKDLDEGIEDLYSGLELAESVSTRWQIVANLAGALSDRSEIRYQPADLDLAIEFAREAANLAGEDPLMRSEAANGLAGCLYERYLADQDRLVDLDEAIELWTEVVESLPVFPPHRPKQLRNLSLGLKERYQHSGHVEDLNAAIRFQREGLELCPSSSPQRTHHSSGLGVLLNFRFAREGSLLDLEESMRLVAEALESIPREAPRHSALQNNLALSYRAYFERFNDPDALNTAIRLATESVAATPEAHSDFPQRVNNLATALLRRGQRGRTGDPDGALADIDAAIALWDRASRLEQLNRSARALIYHGASLGHSARFELSGDSADADAAVGAVERALRSIPEDSPTRPLYLVQAAYAFRLRDGANGEDRRRAVAIYREMANDGVVSAREAGLAARRWGDWAFERQAWAEAVEAYGVARRTIADLVAAQPLRIGQESWLKETKGLTPRAAFAAVRSGDAELAVELAEDLRTKMLDAKLESLSIDLEALERSDPELFVRFTESSRSLVKAENKELSIPEIRRVHEDLYAAHVELRKLPQLEGIGSALTTGEIRAAIDTECLVLPFTTPAGSIAIVLDSDGIEVVEAPLTEKELSDLVSQVGEEVAVPEDRVAASGDTDSGTTTGYWAGLFEAEQLKRALDGLLRQIGARLFAPILETIQRRGHREIVLVPSGDLSLVPWPAVRCGSSPTDDLLDSLASCVSPSIRSWLASRDRIARKVQTRLVAIGSEGSKPGSMPAMPFEVERIAATVDRGRSRVLSADSASLENTTSALADATHLHLACHGHFELRDPVASYIELTDSRLTLRDLVLADVRSRNLQIVTLAACQSAISDFRRFPDEMQGLPVGLLQVGAGGVVAALWQVDDVSTALLMERFYRFHLADGHGPSQALRRAQIWLRDVTAGELVEEFRRFADSGPKSRAEKDMIPEILALLWPMERSSQPFASPYYWGGFVYFGS